MKKVIGYMLFPFIILILLIYAISLDIKNYIENLYEN